MRYAEKMKQANREAKSTVVGLAIVIVAWVVLGFGVAMTGAEVFHTPLWIITGTVGTWFVAIAVAVFMSRRVIVDVDLDDETQGEMRKGPDPCLIDSSEAGDSHE